MSHSSDRSGSVMSYKIKMYNNSLQELHQHTRLLGFLKCESEEIRLHAQAMPSEV